MQLSVIRHFYAVCFQFHRCVLRRIHLDGIVSMGTDRIVGQRRRVCRFGSIQPHRFIVEVIRIVAMDPILSCKDGLPDELVIRLCIIALGHIRVVLIFKTIVRDNHISEVIFTNVQLVLVLLQCIALVEIIAEVVGTNKVCHHIRGNTAYVSLQPVIKLFVDCHEVVQILIFLNALVQIDRELPFERRGIVIYIIPQFRRNQPVRNAVGLSADLPFCLDRHCFDREVRTFDIRVMEIALVTVCIFNTVNRDLLAREGIRSQVRIIFVFFQCLIACRNIIAQRLVRQDALFLSLQAVPYLASLYVDVVIQRISCISNRQSTRNVRYFIVALILFTGDGNHIRTGFNYIGTVFILSCTIDVHCQNILFICSDKSVRSPG